MTVFAGRRARAVLARAAAAPAAARGALAGLLARRPRRRSPLVVAVVGRVALAVASPGLRRRRPPRRRRRRAAGPSPSPLAPASAVAGLAAGSRRPRRSSARPSAASAVVGRSSWPAASSAVVVVGLGASSASAPRRPRRLGLGRLLGRPSWPPSLRAPRSGRRLEEHRPAAVLPRPALVGSAASCGGLLGRRLLRPRRVFLAVRGRLLGRGLLRRRVFLAAVFLAGAFLAVAFFAAVFLVGAASVGGARLRAWASGRSVCRRRRACGAPRPGARHRAVTPRPASPGAATQSLQWRRHPPRCVTGVRPSPAAVAGLMAPGRCHRPPGRVAVWQRRSISLCRPVRVDRRERRRVDWTRLSRSSTTGEYRTPRTPATLISTRRSPAGRRSRRSRRRADPAPAG